MGQLTIALGQTSTKTVFTTNLSQKNEQMLLFMGTNLKNTTTTQNSITVNDKDNYNFLIKAFKAMANLDGNVKDISDADFKAINNSKRHCGNSTILKNQWHSDEPGEFIYHEGDANNRVGRSIWLSNKTDDGV